MNDDAHSTDPARMDLVDASAPGREVDEARAQAAIESHASWPSPRRGRRLKARYAAPAAAAVTLVMVGATVWASDQDEAPPARPALGGQPTAALKGTTTAPTSRSAPTSRPTAGTTASTDPTALAAGLPVLTPGMPLPKNQQYADFIPLSSDMRLKGRTIGLAKVQVDGKPHHLVLVPGTALPGVFEGRSPQGMCIVTLPADDPINMGTSDGWREYACHFLPEPGARTGRGIMGGAGLNGPSSSSVEEFKSLAWPVVTATKAVASVEARFGTTSFPLPYRLEHPDLDGVVFIGFLPDKDTAESRGGPGYVLRDAAGTELFELSSR